jgi:hypothetical protein
MNNYVVNQYSQDKEESAPLIGEEGIGQLRVYLEVEV